MHAGAVSSSLAASPTAAATPTAEQFAAYQALAQYFNERLFEGKLPPVLLNFGRRGRRTKGFFVPDRWQKGRATTHEISLNPQHLAERPPVEIASTLVHELCHLWQQEWGTPSRAGYHNREWADRMERVGLRPTDTGQVGGKRTGQRMSHTLIPDGPFDRAFRALPAAHCLPWTGVVTARRPRPGRSGKVRYTCTGCCTTVWGKPGLALHCPACDRGFIAAGKPFPG